MASVIDLPSIVRSVEAALPNAAPFAMVPMLEAQLRHVDAATGLALLDRIAARVPASAWSFVDDELDSWPEPVGRRALEHVLALPPGSDRILALCTLPRRLTLEQQREALDGILDGTLPESSYEHTKPMTYRPTIAAFVRTLPQAWQEEWIVSKSTDLFAEVLARRELGCFPEAALRRMWSQGHRTGGPHHDELQDLVFIVEHLPSDLKALALASIRADRSQSTRLYRLGYLDVELTDAERYEVVETPWNDYTRNDPRSQAEHLERCASHLPKVPVELRRRWLRTVLAFPEDYDRQRGLMALLPSLEGEDHRQAADALVASVIREGRFYTVATRWDLLPDHALGPLLLRLREDPYGRGRNQIIAHLIEARDPALADRCLQPLLDGLGERAADHCLEIVHALTRWLADRSNGAVPQALAALLVPVPDREANPLYVIERVLAQSD